MKVLPVYFAVPEIFCTYMTFWLILDFSCKISGILFNLSTTPYTAVHANISVEWLIPAL